MVAPENQSSLEAFRIHEEAQNEKLFNELLDVASEITLRHPERTQAYALEAWNKTDHGNTPVRDLGLWGARGALEMAFSPLHVPRPLIGEETMNGEPTPPRVRFLSHNKLVQEPEEFVGPPNPNVQAGIEGFGRALIEEAFDVLGEGAIEKVNEFVNAKDAEEEKAVINWLITRLCSIRDMQYDEDEQDNITGEEFEILLKPVENPVNLSEVTETITINLSAEWSEDDTVECSEITIEDDRFYHPVRLSPKIIGTYPDVKLPTTCLGLSVLAAAFFEKCGVDYLHAGVARTFKQEMRVNQASIANLVEFGAELADIRLPDMVDEALSKIDELYEKTYNVDRGTHAALLIKGKESWWLMDPNFSTNFQIASFEADQITNFNESLKDIAKSAPGVEAMYGFSGLLSEFLVFHASELVDTIPSAEQADFVLRSAQQSDAPLDMLHTYVQHELLGDHISTAKHALSAHWVYSKLLENNDDPAHHKTTEMFFAEKFKETLLSYCFSDANGDDISACLERCKTDDAYRQRRIEDLRMVPLYTALKMISEYTAKAYDEVLRDAHVVMEIGLPHYRIGACVLSDFGVYCDDTLPTDFWLRNWPSHVPFYDRIPFDHSSDDTVLARKFLDMLDYSSLRYYGSYGKIQKFLEQIDDPGEEPDDSEKS